MNTRIKTSSEIKAMRESGRMTATVLQLLKKQLQPGMTTKDLANIAAAEVKAFGVKPAFLGYQGFPDVICISVNDEIVHGIPRTDKVIAEGDIVSMDFGVVFGGMISDSAITAIAGKPRKKSHEKLVEHTEAALHAGIAAVHDRVRAGDIGAAVESSLSRYNYGIVEDLVGHGVGHELHEDPNIPNTGRANTGPWLDAGMTIAIEPMLTLGTKQVYVADDNWTILSYDGSMAAHFEHTILITQDGAEIMSQV